MTVKIYTADQPITKLDTDDMYISSSRWKKICNHLEQNCFDLTVVISQKDDPTKLIFELNKIKNSDHVLLDLDEYNILDLGFALGLTSIKKNNIFVCTENIPPNEKQHAHELLSFYDVAFYDTLEELLSIWFTLD